MRGYSISVGGWHEAWESSHTEKKVKAHEVRPRKSSQELKGGQMWMWQALCYLYGPMANLMQFYLSSMGWTKIERERSFPTNTLQRIKSTKEGDMTQGTHRWWEGYSSLLRYVCLPHTASQGTQSRLAGLWVWMLGESFCTEAAQDNLASDCSDKKQ